jgi:hypothetical protein
MPAGRPGGLDDAQMLMDFFAGGERVSDVAQAIREIQQKAGLLGETPSDNEVEAWLDGDKTPESPAQEAALRVVVQGHIAKVPFLFDETPAEITRLTEPKASKPRTNKKYGYKVLSKKARAQIGTITKSKLANLKESGVVLGGVPLGMRRTKDVDEHGRRILEPDPEEIKTLRRILELDALDFSTRQIVSVLNQEKRRTKNGARWYPATVWKVIQNPPEILRREPVQEDEKKVREKDLIHAPYGYKYGSDGKTLEPNKHEQKIIAMVQRFRERGLSYQWIVKKMASRGVKNRSNRPFTLKTVYALVHGSTSISVVSRTKRSIKFTADQLREWIKRYKAENGGKLPLLSAPILYDGESRSWASAFKQLAGGVKHRKKALLLRRKFGWVERPPLKLGTVIGWVDQFLQEHGTWPGSKKFSNRVIPYDSGRRKWVTALSLFALQLQQHFGRLSRPVDIEEVKSWVARFREENGVWPHLGTIGHLPIGYDGETRKWQFLIRHIGMTWAQFLVQHCGKDATPPPAYRSFTIDKIKEWVELYRTDTGKWPSQQHGVIQYDDRARWEQVDKFLREKTEYGSLSQFMTKHCGKPPWKRKS